MASRSEGRFTLIRSRADLDAYVARRATEPAITAGLLAIEGAHALDDDPANVEVVADAGFRMMSPSHFFDNAFGGSAHGVEKGGLTRAGREMIRRMEARGMLLDLAHASGPTIEEAVAMSRRPVVVSHTGVRGTCDNARNLSDEQLRGSPTRAGSSGSGSGRRPAAATMPRRSPARSSTRSASRGSSTWRSGPTSTARVQVPFDASGMVLLTDALLDAGLDDGQIAKVMGGERVPPPRGHAARGLSRLPGAGRSDELRDERRGTRRAVRGDRAIGDRPVDLERDGLRDRVRVRGRVVHPPAAAVAVEPVGDVAVLLEVVGSGKYRNGRRPATSSIVVVRPPWTTARSAATRWR